LAHWNSTRDFQYPGLTSLREFGKICKYSNVGEKNESYWCTGSLNIKIMYIPDPIGYTPAPFSRVNHAKFVLTENDVYISTSNWSQDYFENTAGIFPFFETNWN
jgi:phospholipase D3/4